MSHRQSLTDNGALPRRPKAIYFISHLYFENIYGRDTQAEIARWVDVSPCLVSPADYLRSNETWPEIEMIFSGWGMPVMDETFLERFPDLKVIFYGAGSVKSFVTDVFWQSGIRLTNAVAANAVPVAEYTCAQVINGLKRCWQTALFIKREQRFPDYQSPPGAYKTTVGLLSLGTIGKLVLEKLRSYDLRIVAYDPFVTAERAASLNVTLLSLDEVFAQADVVSCHTPWLPETERMIRGRHFEMLKPQSTFINTARGAVVAEDEMIAVLQRRPDIFAILDVTYPDPPIPRSPLYSLDNVVLTPHIAGSMGQECRRLGELLVDEVHRYLTQEPLRFELDAIRAAVVA